MTFFLFDYPNQKHNIHNTFFPTFCLTILCLITLFQNIARAQPPVFGTKGHAYGQVVLSDPASEMQQSKLWWHDVIWWGSLWNPASNRYEIYRLDRASQTWQSRGVALDDRNRSKADVLWDGDYLYVLSERYASTGAAASEANSARLYRYSYDASSKSYQPSPGFPVIINSATSETITLAKDGAGKLWATWVQGGVVMVNRSLDDDLSWGTPFSLPVRGGAVSDDDVSAIVAFGSDRIGILWSNQLDQKTYFAVHRDGDDDTMWQAREQAYADPAAGPVSDDHLNIKAAADGTIYIAARTNLTTDGEPGIVLLKRNANGSWSQHVVTLEQLDHSHPVVLLNEENRRVYVVSHSKETGNSAIYLKSASMEELAFQPGLGMPLIESTVDVSISNPSSSKQIINRTTGMSVLADDNDALSYYYRHIDFAKDGPQIVSLVPAAAPAGSTVSIIGKNFHSATRVTFGGISTSTFSVFGDSVIQAIVPANAVSGKIRVTTEIDVASSSEEFVVTQPPKITTFTPTNGPVNTVVTITGDNLGSITSIKFNGIEATNFTIQSIRQLQAVVPPNATTGPITITNADGVGVSSKPFVVTRVPILQSFQPTRAKIGEQITLTGQHFSGVHRVTFADSQAAFIVDSDTQIRAIVPVQAKSGPIRIENSAGVAESDAPFTVLNRLNIAIDGQGEVVLQPPGGLYPQGTVVVLEAQPAPGWEFSDWDDDHDGTSAIDSVVMDADKRITADFEPIPRHTVSISIDGQGAVAIQPPNGPYLRDTIVKLHASPAAGSVFSGYSGDFDGWMLEESLRVDTDKNIIAQFSPKPEPLFAKGIFTSAAEIADLPTGGTLWDNLKSNADVPVGQPNLSDRNDPVNVVVLAKALVYARTGDEHYRTQVIDACMAAMGTEQKGSTLAIGRGLLAYVLAADLVGLPAEKEPTFRAWLAAILTTHFEGTTLRFHHEVRPNNWGTIVGATRAAIARYLNDETELERIARIFRGWLGDRQAYNGFKFGELWWQADSLAPVGINPAGAQINGFPVGGVLPDDQRRGGPFSWPPPRENYVYGALQGSLMTAIILYRAGYAEIWEWQDRALYRAFDWLYNIANYPAEGDDQWLTHIINHYYQTDFEAHYPARPGKNAGYTDWLYGGNYTLKYSERGDGSVEAQAVGVDQNGQLRVLLHALADSGSGFGGWIGDHRSSANPDTVVLDRDKEVVAILKPDGEATLLLDIIGAGTVKKTPDQTSFEFGTSVNLEAVANPGYRFEAWGGDLTGANNPTQVTVNTNKRISATFVATGSNAKISHENTQTGLSNRATILETVDVIDARNDVLYLATIAKRPGAIVTGVSGLGLKWAPLQTQCSAQGHIEIEVWHAIGKALEDTPVLAHFTSATKFAGLIVSQYTGVDVQSPIAAVVSANANGLGGACKGGIDEQNYAFAVQTTHADAALFHAVVAHRQRHTPAPRFVERAQITAGTSGYGFAAAVQDFDAAEVGQIEVTGQFDKPADWASVTVELRAETPNNNAPSKREQAELHSPADAPTIANDAFPVTLDLQPVFPNPFNAQTKITYALPQAAHVRVLIYNILGQQIRELLDAEQRAGFQQIIWDGRDRFGRAVSSGIYLVALHIDGERRLLRRMVLQK